MPVPEFYHFIRPALCALASGETKHLQDVRDEVIKALNLSEEDLSELVASGSTSKAYDRTQWALAYLRAARLVDQPKRAYNVITDRGRKFLETAPQVIKPADLRQFPEFLAFAKGKKADKGEKLDSDQTTESITPEEALQEAHVKLRQKLSEDVLDRVKSMSPAFFERLIVQLMLRLGYGGPSSDSGKVLGKVGDGGVDGVINQDKLGLEKIYLQAKRYTNGSVGSAEVQAFAGALMGHGARKGVFITTSTFSSSALSYANGLKDYKISLIDGIELAELMIDNDLGVALARRYDVKRVDSDYFSEG